jgi:hypothetical protein
MAMWILALNAGKPVLCEKPLCGKMLSHSSGNEVDAATQK